MFILGTRLPDIELTFPEPSHYSIRRANFAGGRELTFDYAIGKPDDSLLFPTCLTAPTSVREAISDLPAIESNGGTDISRYRKVAKSTYQMAMRRNSKQLFNHHCNGVQPINLERLKHIPPGGSWRDIPFDLLPAGMKRARRSDHTRRYGRFHPDEPSGTILTRCDPTGGLSIIMNRTGL